MRKRTYWHMRQAKTQISLRIRAVWSQSSLSARSNLHPWLSIMRPMKILIRLRECAGWSESSLGAHVLKVHFWRCRPFVYGSLISCHLLHKRLLKLKPCFSLNFAFQKDWLSWLHIKMVYYVLIAYQMTKIKWLLKGTGITKEDNFSSKEDNFFDFLFAYRPSSFFWKVIYFKKERTGSQRGQIHFFFFFFFFFGDFFFHREGKNNLIVTSLGCVSIPVNVIWCAK